MPSSKSATNSEVCNEHEKITILVVVAPDKDLSLKASTCPLRTYIRMFKRTEALLEALRKQSAADLERLMGLSRKLADSHVQRFQDFERLPPKQAALLFGGRHLGADDFSGDDRSYAQKHLRLLSGLYGVLRPYDDVRPVRDIPMHAPLHTPQGKHLLEFWGDAIRRQLLKDLAEAGGAGRPGLLLGCTGAGSWEAVQASAPLPDGVLARRAVFAGSDGKEARKAQGLLARHVVRSRVDTLHALKKFAFDGWTFESSSSAEIVFARRRGQPALAGDLAAERRRRRRPASRAGSSSSRQPQGCPSSPVGGRRKRHARCRSSSPSASPRRKAARRRETMAGTR